MWVLGLDTATWTASVGVVRDGIPIAQRSLRAESSHAPAIVGLVDETLAAAGVAVGRLDAVAVSAGPGSFTGLRIGLSTAKGLAYAIGAHLVAVPTLEALARAAGPRPGTVCAVLDARRGEVYAACYRWRGEAVERVAVEQVIAPAELDRMVKPPCTFVGDGVEAYAEVLRERFGEGATLLSLAAVPPSGSMVARIAWERIRAGVDTCLASVEPYYVRPSEAERKAI